MTDNKESSKFPLQYEEINAEEYQEFSKNKAPNGNFYYHVYDDQYILMVIENGEVEYLIFLAMADLEMYTSGNLDLEDELYLEYEEVNRENLNDYETVIHDNFKEFIQLVHPDQYSKYFKNN